MEKVNTPNTASAAPVKSFMTAGPTLHYSHTNVLWFWFLTVVVYVITCMFWYSIVAGGPISFQLSEFKGGLLLSLGRFTTEPISIFEYPQYIIVLGILMGILAVGPMLVSQLLSFRYCIPLVLALMFIAKLYLFGVMVVIGCIAVACRPLRFRSRFISMALCMAPQLVYWAIWGGHRTPDAVFWGMSYAPWISSWLMSLVMAAIILGIGHFTRYKPGLNWLTFLVFLVIGFSVFQQTIGFAELDYQRRIENNSPEDIEEFHDVSLSATLDQIIADPALRSKLEGRFYPTHNPEEFRQALTEDIRDSLNLVNRWPEWFRRNMPDQFKFQIKRQELMIAYEQFIDRWSSNRKRLPAALYYRAMLSELHPDLRDICSKEMLRFYNDYPFENNIFNWQELYDQFPGSLESCEARWRIAMFEAGQGNFETATEISQSTLSLIEDKKEDENLPESTNPASLSAAFQEPPTTVMTSFKIEDLTIRLLKLQSLISKDNQGDTDVSKHRLAEFVRLNPYELSYEMRLNSLLEGLDQEDPLRDNIMLEKALLAKDQQRCLKLLNGIIEKYSTCDAAVQARYEAARTKIQIWKSMDDSEEDRASLLNEVLHTLSELIQKYPDTAYSSQADSLLKTLPKAR